MRKTEEQLTEDRRRKADLRNLPTSAQRKKSHGRRCEVVLTAEARPQSLTLENAEKTSRSRSSDRERRHSRRDRSPRRLLKFTWT
ncbi:hypothetical protein L596_014545 [Steinernema carpocapsae]|uniref:Uncharacterized protein n=1 Tax=Steinernema carpocapsae TaxID=34508 RepID=A0A4V6A2V1_STECR|nr:hypothetical protein L596_014545 [Steinernema carpocapsae]